MIPEQFLCKKNARCAFSLVEFAIVLGVVGVILGAIWIAASSVGKSAQVQAAYDDTMTIVSNMQALGMGMSDLSGYGSAGANITTQMKSAGVFPKHAFDPAGAGPFNPWHGNFIVNIGSSTSSFTINVTGIPTDDCLKFMRRILDAGGLKQVLTAAGWKTPFAAPPAGIASTDICPLSSSYVSYTTMEFNLRYQAP